VNGHAETQWHNWARTERAHAVRVVSPGSVQEVVAEVKQASADGLRIKAVGSGHSFTGVAVTDGVRVILQRLDRILDVDTERLQVRVQAGITLRRLNRELWSRGLALTNLGDVDAQTVAGAISTGTHGTGARFGGLATHVIALEMVLADGSVVECGVEQEPDMFAAARIGLGALGIVTTLTLQCEPAYALHAVETPGRLGEVLDRFDALADGTDHFEVPYWFPHTDRLLLKRNTRRPPVSGLGPLRRLRGWFDDEVMANGVYGLMQLICAARPALIPRMNAAAGSLVSAREFTDRSYRVFVSPRRVRFREMEYAVPRADATDVLAELADWFARTDERISIPVEVRVAAADDIWLSTAHRRDTAYVAVHQYHRLPHAAFFSAVEPIFRAVGGRPHWGKMHSLTAQDLRPLYPRFDDFVALRRELDPTARFTNPYLDRVLGEMVG
jgi:L-gulono-1,4-lactone dehydrogenase